VAFESPLNVLILLVYDGHFNHPWNWGRGRVQCTVGVRVRSWVRIGVRSGDRD